MIKINTKTLLWAPFFSAILFLAALSIMSVSIVGIGSAYDNEIHSIDSLITIGRSGTITYEVSATSEPHGGWVFVESFKVVADFKNKDAKMSPSSPDPFYIPVSLVENVERLTPYTSDTWDESPSFSSDGTKILFESCTIKMGSPVFDDNVWIMDIGGNNKKRLSKSDYYDGSPSFSSDGTKIVFESAPNMLTFSVKRNLWEMNIDGSKQKQVKMNETLKFSSQSSSETDCVTYPSWSPDDNKIVFESDYKIWMISSDGGNLTLLTPNHAFDLYPSWSSDGNEIIFVSSKVWNETAPLEINLLLCNNTDIWTMNSDGSNRKQLTSDDGFKWEPSYSPDGTKVVFTLLQFGIPSIWIMDSDGTNKQQLTSKYPAVQPKWSPDGTKIVFASNGDIWMMTLNVTPIATPTSGLPPTVSPTTVQLSPTSITPAPNLALTPTPTPTVTSTVLPTEATSEEKKTPGFEAVFSFAGLSVLVYLLRTKKQ